MFVLLASWRKTPTWMSLEDRMALTFHDAGVSITVTTLTDGVSFGIGCMTTIPSVEIFCLYAAVAILFVYVYQLTFLAGVFVLTSRREISGRHCLTFQKVKHKVTGEPKGKKEKSKSDCMGKKGE